MAYLLIGLAILISALVAIYLIKQKKIKTLHSVTKELDNVTYALLNVQQQYDETRNTFNQLAENIKFLKDESSALEENLELKKREFDSKMLDSQMHAINTYKQVSNELVEIAQKKLNNIQECEKKIQILQNSYNARLKTIQLEQAKEAERQYFQIQLDANDKEDVTYLHGLRNKVHKPDVLNKLVWKTYVEGPANEMILRVLGPQVHTGIYKITNVDSGKVYIGQSVNVRNRWLQHIKRGIGAEIATNATLYLDMDKSCIWNFTFELIEDCDALLLNEREAFWIDFYDSKEQGLNETAGNKR